MPDEVENLVRRMIGGAPEAPAEILAAAPNSTAPTLLVAAALIAEPPNEHLVRAARYAATTRDRQLLALAAAHLNTDDDLLDALVRDHLADHPDNILAAWIAAQHVNPDIATSPHC